MTKHPGNERANIAVVGSGVIGLAIAFRLAREHRNVVLIDRDEPGGGASIGNAGHIATEQIFPLASPSTLVNAPGLLMGRNGAVSVRREYARKIAPWLIRFMWASRHSAYRLGTSALSSLQDRAMDAMQRLCDDADMTAILQRRGHMIVAEQRRSVAKLERQQRVLASHGIAADLLDGAAVLARAPELPADIAGALLVRNTGHVTDPYALCTGLLDAFRDAGGRSIRKSVRTIGANSANGFDLTTDTGILTCEKTVICAGAWSRPLAAALGSDVPLDTERGYNVTAPGFDCAFDVSIASLERMTIMTPMSCGLRITGFVEFGGLDLPPTQARIDALTRHLRALLPNARFPELTSWLGFRPSLPDHLPVIGRSPRHSNAFFAFGHQHLGLTLSGVTSEVIADQISGRSPAVDVTAFRAERFS